MKKKTEFVETEVELAPPEPNVAFVGKEWRADESGKMKLLPKLYAPEKVNTAKGTIHLAPSEVQTESGARGFYSEHADFLIAQFPPPSKAMAGDFYTKPKAKGE